VELSSHGVGLLKDSSVPRDSSSKASPEWPTSSSAVEHAPIIPEEGASTLGSQLDRFASLALQQHG